MPFRYSRMLAKLMCRHLYLPPIVYLSATDSGSAYCGRPVHPGRWRGSVVFQVVERGQGSVTQHHVVSIGLVHFTPEGG